LIFKSEDVALRLIQAGADVNGIVNECAMLDFAAMLGLSKVTAELKKRNAQSFYELMFAYSKYARAGALGQMQVAECILYEGAEKPSEQHLALCVAVYSGHREFVKALLDGGVDPSCVRGGHSALMVACMRGHRGIAQDLIRAKADVSAKNVLNFTAMQLAARFKHRDIVQLLLNRGKK
jgi:ankyrin repeat protein